MEVAIEKVGELTKKITITLPEADVKSKLDEAYDKLKRETKIKGFRRGKVPRSVVVKNYKQQVEAEIGEKLVQETYFDIIEKQDFDPVTHPNITSVKYNDDGSFTYVAEVDSKPEFELGQYKGLEIEKVDSTVTDEEIDAEIAEMQKNMASLKTVEDKGVEEGNVVVIDFQGFHKGHAMKQVKNDDYTVDVGSGRMGKEFEEKIVGMKAGEEASHEVDFPEGHQNPILEGKTVEFKVTVKDIKERVLADLDDEFAKDAGPDFKTMQDLKDSILDRKKKEKEEAAEGSVADRIVQELLKTHEFEVPERLAVYEAEQMIKQTEQQLQQAGMTLEAAGLNRDEMSKNNMPVAIQRVRGDFILKKISEVEELKVNEEDLERGFKRISEQYNMSVAQVKEYFGSRDDLLPFMNELLNEKVLNFLREESVIVEAKPVEEKVEVSEEAAE